MQSRIAVRFRSFSFTSVLSLTLACSSSEQAAEIIPNPSGDEAVVTGSIENEPHAEGTVDQPGFRYVRVAEGFEQGVGFALAADARIFVAEKQGRVRLVRDQKLLAEPFLDFTQQVNAAQDRGLLSVAVHPRFPSVPFVYLAYTYDPPAFRERSDAAGPDAHGARTSRVVRVEADPQHDYDRMLPGSEIVLLGKQGLERSVERAMARNDYEQPVCGTRGTYEQDCLPADEVTHTMGMLAFGPDESLYVGHGDGCDYARAQPTCTRALDVDSLSGKILRVDALTGRGLADNPFADAQDLDANRSKVFQVGLRNPFRFSIDSQTGALYVGDVGWNEWEEINRGPAGANFGWPCYEGGNGISVEQAAYRDLSRCAELRDSGAVITAPLFAYSHSEHRREGSAVIVGSVYRGHSYPAPFRGSLFYADINRQQLRFLPVDSKEQVVRSNLFAEGTGAITQITADPSSGELYLMVLGGPPEQPQSAIERLVFTGYGRAPMSDKPYALRSSVGPHCVEAAPSDSNEAAPSDSNEAAPSDSNEAAPSDSNEAAPSDANGLALMLRTCASTAAQRWLLTSADGELYSIRDESLDHTVFVDEQTIATRQVGLRRGRDDSPSEKFYLLPQGDGHQIISAATERCLSVAAPSDPPTLSAVECLSSPEQTFLIASENNRPPEIAAPERQFAVLGAPASLQVVAVDPELGDLTFSAAQLPRGLSIDPHSGLIAGVPTLPGSYVVRVRVTDGELQASTSFGWVVHDTKLPRVGLHLPAEGERYRAGEVVHFAASAHDYTGSPLAPEKLAWSLVTHHNLHMHWGGFSAVFGESGTLVYGDHGDNTSLELCVQATDADGRRAGACRALLPLTVEYTIDSVPSGLELAWEGVRRTTPFVVQPQVGGRRDLVAPLLQSNFAFAAWSDGGHASHVITIDAAPQRLVATYSMPGSDALAAP